MGRPSGAILAAILGIAFAGLAGLFLLKGGLYTATHEGDLYHHLDIVFRMARGQVIHVDFMTPLGLFAMLPHALFIASGWPVGMAFILAQISVTALLLPVIWWTASTRFPGWIAHAFGLSVLAILMALVHGGAFVGLSISMHYNRWAWAVSFLALALALLPNRRGPAPMLDGGLIGALMAALVLLKATYFMALAPVVLVALLWPFSALRLAAAVAGGFVVAGIVTLAYGVGFWFAYLGDLITVATGEIRSYPGEPIEELIGGSPFIGGTMVAIALLFVLNRAGQGRLALILVLLLPAAIYITWQNFGNDPIWLLLLGFLGLAARPAPGAATVPGGDAHVVVTCLAFVAMAFAFPSIFHMATSPLRHAAMPPEKYERLLPDTPGQDDWFITTDRARTMDALVHFDVEGSVWAPQAEAVGREERPSLAGISFPYCEFKAGTVAWFQEITRDLTHAGVPDGAQLLTIDIVSAMWLAGPFEPLEGGAPWYYGELSGLENAEYIVVPRCTFVENARRQMIEDIVESGIELSLVRENELYWLFATPQAKAVIAR